MALAVRVWSSTATRPASAIDSTMSTITAISGVMQLLRRDLGADAVLADDDELLLRLGHGQVHASHGVGGLAHEGAHGRLHLGRHGSIDVDGHRGGLARGQGRGQLVGKGDADGDAVLLVSDLDLGTVDDRRLELLRDYRRAPPAGPGRQGWPLIRRPPRTSHRGRARRCPR